MFELKCLKKYNTYNTQRRYSSGSGKFMNDEIVRYKQVKAFISYWQIELGENYNIDESLYKKTSYTLKTYIDTRNDREGGSIITYTPIDKIELPNLLMNYLFKNGWFLFKKKNRCYCCRLNNVAKMKIRGYRIRKIYQEDIFVLTKKQYQLLLKKGLEEKQFINESDYSNLDF